MNVYEAIAARRTVRSFEDIPIASELVEKIIDAGLRAPTNDHLRNWEFVLVDDRNKRAKLLKVEDLPDREECDKMLDDEGMTDRVQRDMYHAAMPRQFSMLYTAGCLILPFFKVDAPLLQPHSLSSLNSFASIWCCIENMLLAAASEGIFGVTRIPMTDESVHIKTVVGHPDDYVMPCYVALGYPAKDAVRPEQKSVCARDKIRTDVWGAERR